MPEAVFVATGKFDKSVAYLLEWLLLREKVVLLDWLKHRTITKIYREILNIPLQIYINLELVFLKHANYSCRAAG
jgi:hypothetical protein